VGVGVGVGMRVIGGMIKRIVGGLSEVWDLDFFAFIMISIMGRGGASDRLPLSCLKCRATFCGGSLWPLKTMRV